MRTGLGKTKKPPAHADVAAAVVVALALALAASCAGGHPPQSPETPRPEATEPYGFLVTADPVGRAMATIWRAQFEQHSDLAEARADAQAVEDASAVVEGDSGRAVALLMPTLLTLLPNDDGGYLALGPLLRLIGGDPEIVGYFRRLLLAAQTVEEDSGEGDPPPATLVRAFALAQIVEAAEQGSEPAGKSLLDLVESGDAEVRAGAISGYYRISSDRREAQRAMRKRLDPEHHYLLYRY